MVKLSDIDYLKMDYTMQNSWSDVNEDLKEMNKIWNPISGLRNCSGYMEFALDTIRVKMEWISVKDRLPNKNESIGYVFDGKEIRHNVYYHGFNGSWESENSLGYYVDENITHWMPLPNIPTE
jgi:Protein of unknown function (DUF551)